MFLNVLLDLHLILDLIINLSSSQSGSPSRHHMNDFSIFELEVDIHDFNFSSRLVIKYRFSLGQNTFKVSLHIVCKSIVDILIGIIWKDIILIVIVFLNWNLVSYCIVRNCMDWLVPFIVVSVWAELKIHYIHQVHQSSDTYLYGEIPVDICSPSKFVIAVHAIDLCVELWIIWSAVFFACSHINDIFDLERAFSLIHAFYFQEFPYKLFIILAIAFFSFFIRFAGIKYFPIFWNDSKWMDFSNLSSITN